MQEPARYSRGWDLPLGRKSLKWVWMSYLHLWRTMHLQLMHSNRSPARLENIWRISICWHGKDWRKLAWKKSTAVDFARFPTTSVFTPTVATASLAGWHHWSGSSDLVDFPANIITVISRVGYQTGTALSLSLSVLVRAVNFLLLCDDACVAAQPLSIEWWPVERFHIARKSWCLRLPNAR